MLHFDGPAEEEQPGRDGASRRVECAVVAPLKIVWCCYYPLVGIPQPQYQSQPQPSLPAIPNSNHLIALFAA